ncbi:uncharacterized protein [Spinacia oleracea]|uniref:Retrotransposon Copia-like N-terminal domain-containing protein n=1 Tax=Spinacia oleracea TaxID=3562 RepID=A0ABM3QZI1_SPIOL|nr:uncharacterized protein LOC130463609 [Spinacia oleracea]
MGSRYTFSDMQNLLFIHPFDGPLSISVTKLQGAADYRAWRRSFEIQLSSKRKLGFVNGTVTRSIEDDTNATQWDTCNDLVTCWLHTNVSDSIKNSILFIKNAHEAWKQLEKRFMLSNGSRKYKLSKDLFNLKQNGRKIDEYYTAMSSLWDEIESMNMLPMLTTVAQDVTALMKAIETQKEKSKLFQFLNGLDDFYSPQRSQLLMQSPLPSVESACAVIQQEETQRDVLIQNGSFDSDTSAMYSKGSVSTDRTVTCTACGIKGHTSERCWTVVGYPKWHYKYNKKPGNKGENKNQFSGTRWSGNKGATSSGVKSANTAQGMSEKDDEIVFSS